MHAREDLLQHFDSAGLVEPVFECGGQHLGPHLILADFLDQAAAGEIDEMGEYSKIAQGDKDTSKPNTNHPAYQPTEGYGRGVVAGINKGYFRRHIAEASYRFSEECEAKDRIIVGVNEYVDNEESRPIDILTIPDSVETEQVSRLADFKARRDKGAVEKALTEIRESCRDGKNVMPALVDGALANCTLGEMVQAMADIYGRYSGGPEW